MIRTLSELGRRITYVARNRTQIARLVQLNCCNHPPEQRKTDWRRHLDLIYMTIRWGEPSTLYYAQQVDLVEKSVRRDFLSYQYFRHIRDFHNRSGSGSQNSDYTCLLQDKLVFERYYSSTGLPTAPVLGIVRGGLVDGFPRHSTRPLDFWDWGQENFSGQPLFCKPQHGIKGKGVFKLQFEGDRASANGVSVTREELFGKFKTPYIIQRLIVQHPRLAELHPESLNTLRVITFNANGNVELFLTYLRMGAAGLVNDNNNESRAIVRVDQETGRLYDSGFAIQGAEAMLADAHPTTSIKFSGRYIPHFDACRDLAISAHHQIPSMLSIGWDIAITPDGPLLLEGNDDWGATTAMWAMPDFRDQFMSRTFKR